MPKPPPRLERLLQLTQSVRTRRFIVLALLDVIDPVSFAPVDWRDRTRPVVLRCESQLDGDGHVRAGPSQMARGKDVKWFFARILGSYLPSFDRVSCQFYSVMVHEIA